MGLSQVQLQLLVAFFKIIKARHVYLFKGTCLSRPSTPLSLHLEPLNNVYKNVPRADSRQPFKCLILYFNLIFVT